VALALAYAFVAGDWHAKGLKARAKNALGELPSWLDKICEQFSLIPAPVWQRLSTEELALRILHDTHFMSFDEGESEPEIKRWILRSSHMHTAPLGLSHCEFPPLPDLQSLCEWLQIEPQTLSWYVDNPWRFQTAPLAQQHYHFHLLAKPRGGLRLIEAPYAQLKALQRRIHQDLLQKVPVHEACHGFAKHRSVVTHAKLHTQQDVVMQFDLRDFFHRITASRVLAIFRTLGYPEAVSRALMLLCTYQTPTCILQRLGDAHSLETTQAQILKRRHLPQGAPTSPTLANLSAFKLDLRLEGLATKFGAVYSRYADDMVLSGDHQLKSHAPYLLNWIHRITAEEGYQIHHRKTRLATQAAQQRVTGIVVNHKPNLPRQSFDELRAVLHQCVLKGPTSQNRMALKDFKAHLSGRIEWTCQLNPRRRQRLHKLWQAIDWSR
jgi:hypothetical protein